MEMKIEQITSGSTVFNNVVINGSANELVEYMKNFESAKPNNTTIGFMTHADKKILDPEITESDIDSWAENINIEGLLIDAKLLKQEDRTALLNCLPIYINKCRVIDSSKIPQYFVKAYDSVNAYVFSCSSVEKSLEYTIAKYNKLMFDRTHPDNIICIYRIDGKIVVFLTQYPVRESL